MDKQLLDADRDSTERRDAMKSTNVFGLTAIALAFGCAFPTVAVAGDLSNVGVQLGGGDVTANTRDRSAGTPDLAPARPERAEPANQPAGPVTLTRYVGGCARGDGGVVPCNARVCPPGLVMSTPVVITLATGAASPPITEWTWGSADCYPPVADDAIAVTPAVTPEMVAAEFRDRVAPRSPSPSRATVRPW